MGEQNENIERLNRSVANVENILPWLNKRLETANKLSADGSPDLARREESNIQIMAEFYPGHASVSPPLPLTAADQGF